MRILNSRNRFRTVKGLWELERERKKVQLMQRVDYIGALMCVGVLALTIPIVITFIIVWLIM